MAYGKNDMKIGDWSIDKLEFLKRYLPLYIKATQKAPHKYYIDAFAGNGIWKKKTDGSLVPGSASITLDYHEEFTKLFFIEMKEKRVKNLKKLIDDKDAKQNSFVIRGDCNKVISKALIQIHKKAPTFVFLDPSGDHLHWKTIELLSNWKTELFILYPWNVTLVRYLTIEKNIEPRYIERLDNFFGTNDWYPIYMEKHRDYLMSELLNLYISRLNRIGYEHCHISDCFRVKGGPKLYYMIWVGKHKAGRNIMKWVYEQQNPQLSLFDNIN